MHVCQDCALRFDPGNPFQRLGEMGIFEGETIEVIGVAPLGDPLEIRIGDGRLSLRREEAAGIEIEEADAKRG